MRLLLDTHVVLWALQSPDELTPSARAAIRDAREIKLSVVSPWELTIKAALGKLVLHRPVEDMTREMVREFGAEVLAISLPHVLEVGRLPPHHGDPFDRLLVAQARVEGLALVTRDGWIDRYEVEIVRA